jgi:hypothetical protein
MSTELPDCDESENTITDITYGESPDVSGLNRLVDDNFLTVLNLPKCLGGYTKEVCGTDEEVSLKSLQLSIMSLDIPAINIPTHKAKYLSATRKESSKSLTEYDDITISFKLDDQLINYNTLYNWLNMLVNTKTGTMSNKTKVDYETTYDVILLDEYRKPIGLYTVHGVIPVGIGSIPLDYKSTGESIFLDFTFSFDFLSFELSPN